MSRPRSFRGALLLVLGALLLASCGAPAASGPAAGAAQTGPAAPALSVTTLDGEPFVLAQQRGRPVLLFFMAAWCVTCIPVAQDLDQLTKMPRAQDLVVLAVDVDATETAADLQAFRQQAGGPAKHWAIDHTRQIARAYGVKALDTTILISRQGQVAYRNEGRQPLATLLQQVTSLA